MPFVSATPGTSGMMPPMMTLSRLHATPASPSACTQARLTSATTPAESMLETSLFSGVRTRASARVNSPTAKPGASAVNASTAEPPNR